MKELEVDAIGAVRDLLRNVKSVQSIECEQAIGRDHGMDGLVAFAHRGGNYALVVEVKSNGAPRFVRSGVYQLESCVARLRRSGEASGGRHLIPMIVSPYLSPEARAICLDHDIAYLDLVGNARLEFDTVYIERAVADKPVSETRALRSIFSPKAAAILRVLLREPGRAWRVADLAAQARASYGHVSNVRKALLAREWIEVGEEGVVLIQPDALLQTWRESYRRPAGESVTGYTHLHGTQLDERLRGTLNPNPDRPRAIFALHSAAQWLAPFSRSATHSFYADEPGAEALREALKLTHAAWGANVVLFVPTDENLFHDAIEAGPGVFCTSPIVTYLDLWTSSDRDREAAEHLAGEFFPWLS
ncbi:MAG: hypothetical protein OXQ29_11260 [Rhodospirillaceae bacterium]|nr:hypothetical protein [Rhodospirillaceae bacterium]